jgi:hypothetical protein
VLRSFFIAAPHDWQNRHDCAETGAPRSTRARHTGRPLE